MKSYLSHVCRSALRCLVLLMTGAWMTGTAIASQGGFTISASNEVITQGMQGNSSIIVTPLNGYTGDITFAVTGASPTFSNGCVLFSNYANVSGVNPTTVGDLTVATQNFACPSNTVGNKIGGETIGRISPNGPLRNGSQHPRPIEIALGGVLLTGLFGVRSHKLRRLACLMILIAVGGLSVGCSEPAPQLTPKGSYVMTLVGTDSSATPNLTATTTFTVTIN